MKRRIILLFGMLLLISCESNENKTSRLTIDKYARKLNSIILDISKSREEEGSQSRLTLNNFYERYTSRLENFNNDLAFEVITEKYRLRRDELISISRNLYEYLNIRKSAIIDLSETMSAYKSAIQHKEDFEEYLANIRSSSYLRGYYTERASASITKRYDEQINLMSYQFSYLSNLSKMDSFFFAMDSISTNYNQSLKKVALIDSISFPKVFHDTINDWLMKNKWSIGNLKAI